MSRLIRRHFIRDHPGARGDPSLVGGKRWTYLDTKPRWFETDYFKYGAAPQYLVQYWFEANVARWSCTCPDFVYRRSANGTMCKHCEGAALLIRQPSTFVLKHVSEISQGMYNLIDATPLGQPLPLFGQRVTAKVFISGEPGYVSFTNRWRCYTCGGTDGSTFLKGKQCKHIACYVHSLSDASYMQYCQVMQAVPFAVAHNRQWLDGNTNWQRFT